MLHVMHAIGDVSSLACDADGYVTALPDMQREVENAARQQLTELLSERVCRCRTRDRYSSPLTPRLPPSSTTRITQGSQHETADNENAPTGAGQARS
jgi:hypothetical protein